MTYLEKLNLSWKAHLAEKANNAPTVISTFAGTGGSSLGYSMAGFKELLAVEWEDHAAQNFQLNFPEVPLFHGDIATLSVDECLKKAKIRPGELDIFDGSPPCQGFSTIGKREFSDTRNQLFQEFVRLLTGLRPKIFVMENVSGMVKGKMKLIFADILRALKESGYQVTAKLLNAQFLGVPQSRERMIFIGIRNDLGIAPTFPNPQVPLIPVKEALIKVQNKTFLEPNPKYIELMNKLRPGQNLSRLMKGSFFSCKRGRWNRPNMTITKSISFVKVSVWHPLESRNLSIEEAKRIGSFPDGFQLVGSYTEQWARIGNSVPPLMMMAIANHLKSSVLDLLKSRQASN